MCFPIPLCWIFIFLPNRKFYAKMAILWNCHGNAEISIFHYFSQKWNFSEICNFHIHIFTIHWKFLTEFLHGFLAKICVFLHICIDKQVICDFHDVSYPGTQKWRGVVFIYIGIRYIEISWSELDMVFHGKMADFSI